MASKLLRERQATMDVRSLTSSGTSHLPKLGGAMSVPFPRRAQQIQQLTSNAPISNHRITMHTSTPARRPINDSA
eukprot:scaffold278242_cov20-Prasinocladus_malaysianus.AAC.1